VVTGGGSGLGREMALALAAAAFEVIVTGRTEEKLRETAAAAAGKVDCAVLDVADGAAVRALFNGLERIDVLVNNAGTGAPAAAVPEVSEEDWRRVVDTNLTGSFLCAQAAFALMLRQDPKGGRIINNGSISAHVPRPQGIAYTASKHAITGLTKSLALDGRPYGIACGQIDVGNAATELASAMASGVPQPDGSVRPEPTMDVAEVGRAVAHMASLPLDTNVLFMTIMATNMPYAGRG
jgi:NAD(P)-dependent dehydrogenase (short-subunit alcohol dehydrogenase family)